MGLLSQSEKRTLVSPDDSVAGGGGVWGHFVELHEDEQRLSPRPRSHRRPIRFGTNQELEGFILQSPTTIPDVEESLIPDLDDAVNQLRNMSF